MKTKEKELLALLHERAGSFVSSKELASCLDLSSRTIRTYIHRLEPVIQEHGAVIEARQGCGYCLQVNPESSLESLISEKRLQDPEHPRMIDDVRERRNFIFQKLLLESPGPDVFELADQLYVSESTIRKDMGAVRQIVCSYDLSLKQDREGRFHVTGEESRKRALIMDCFFRNDQLNSLKEFIDHSGYFKEVSSEAMLMMIIEETRRENLQLSDIMIQNIMMHLALCIKRVRGGFRLESIRELAGQPRSSSEARASKAMMNRLSRALGLEFSQEETDYLTLHLCSRAQGKSGSQRPDSLVEEVRTVLVSIGEHSRWDLTEDSHLEEALLDHLVPMLTRLHSHISQANPLTQDLKRDHPRILELVKEEFSRMPSLQGLEVSDDEWAYLALHVMAAAERADEKKKLQVLVICSTGYGSSQLLHSRLMKYFSGSIHIVSETGAFSMTEETLKGVDLIISTINLGPIIFGVPFIHVSVFLNDDDIAAISRMIEGRYQKRTSLAEMADRENQNRIFHRYFNSSRFLVFGGNCDSEMILDELIRLLDPEQEGTSAKQMKEQIRLRRKMGSVAFSDTIVVPHPAVPLTRKASFSVGLVPEGVFWDEEHPQVKFFLLMSPSCIENDGLKEITAAIVSLLEEEEMQKIMLKNPTFQQFELMFKSLIRKQH